MSVAFSLPSGVSGVFAFGEPGMGPDRAPDPSDESPDQAVYENAVLIDHDGLPVADIFGIDAYVVERGPLGTFGRFRGRAMTTVLSDQFDFQIDAGQGIDREQPIGTMLFPQTRIFSPAGEELSADAIEPEAMANVDGILAVSDVDPDVLRAAFIIIERDPEESLKLSGTVLEIDEADSSMRLAAASGDRCIDASGADVYVLSLEEGMLVSTKVELGALEMDQAVDVFGTEGADGCFAAETTLPRAPERCSTTPPLKQLVNGSRDPERSRIRRAALWLLRQGYAEDRLNSVGREKKVVPAIAVLR